MPTLKENFFKNSGLAVNPLNEWGLFNFDGKDADGSDKIKEIIQSVNDAHSNGITTRVYFGEKGESSKSLSELLPILPQITKDIKSRKDWDKERFIISIENPKKEIDFPVSVPVFLKVLSKIDSNIIPKNPKSKIDNLADEMSNHIDWGAGFSSFGQFVAEYVSDAVFMDEIRKKHEELFKNATPLETYHNPSPKELTFDLLYKMWNAKKGIGKLPKNQ